MEYKEIQAIEHTTRHDFQPMFVLGSPEPMLVAGPTKYELRIISDKVLLGVQMDSLASDVIMRFLHIIRHERNYREDPLLIPAGEYPLYLEAVAAQEVIRAERESKHEFQRLLHDANLLLWGVLDSINDLPKPVLWLVRLLLPLDICQRLDRRQKEVEWENERVFLEVEDADYDDSCWEE